MKLKGKIAVITGGNSGIGLGIAKEFKAEGASLVILGRDRQTLDEAQKELGADTLVIQGDITKMDDLERLYENTAEKFGKVDVLVVNAGIGEAVFIDQVDEAHFDNLVNINFKGAYFTIQKASPYLNEGASIILISSIAHKMGMASLSVYSATKAALSSLAKTLSADFLSRKIRVNVISPGPIDTPGLKKSGVTEEEIAQIKQVVEKKVPLNRFGIPREIATVAVFLASSDSSFIIGEEITVDGGQSQQIDIPN